MKGLFVKDLCLLRSQSRASLLIVVMGIAFSLTNDGVFGTGYIGVLFATLALSTLSYDEYDHGYPFLFTLPFTRKEYIREKFLFSLLMGLGGTLLGACVDLLSGNILLDEVLFTAVGVSAVLLLLSCVMIPMRLKFDNEQGRTLTGLILGLLIAAVILAAKLVPPEKLSALAAAAESGTGIAAATAIGALLVFLSYGASVRILEAKEF